MQLEGLFNLQIMLFLEIGLGWFLRKKELITAEGKRVITDLVIDVFLPCNIIQAFQIELTRDVLMSSLQILLVSIVLQLFCTVISATCYRRFPEGEKKVLKYATLCSNAGLLGNPVAEGLYGSLGLMYASIYLIPQRIIMWSVGLSYFTESSSKKEVVRKVVTHPCIIAVAIGMVLMVSGIPLPGFLSRTISSIASCNTAVTMILIGTIMAGADLRTLLTKTDVFYAGIRLVFIPCVVLAGCLLAHTDPLVASVAVILAAMPAGSTTVILASKYHQAEEFASKIVIFTTLLSVVAIPVWSLILMRLF
ncbi:MAG: AEC family transporter [Clostridiales bacterium]|nr:AEC family transporter [Clostridiales bacterium]